MLWKWWRKAVVTADLPPEPAYHGPTKSRDEWMAEIRSNLRESAAYLERERQERKASTDRHPSDVSV